MTLVCEGAVGEDLCESSCEGEWWPLITPRSVELLERGPSGAGSVAP